MVYEKWTTTSSWTISTIRSIWHQRDIIEHLFFSSQHKPKNLLPIVQNGTTEKEKPKISSYITRNTRWPQKLWILHYSKRWKNVTNLQMQNNTESRKEEVTNASHSAVNMQLRTQTHSIPIHGDLACLMKWRLPTKELQAKLIIKFKLNDSRSEISMSNKGKNKKTSKPSYFYSRFKLIMFAA